jgi:hypothetical protein
LTKIWSRQAHIRARPLDFVAKTRKVKMRVKFMRKQLAFTAAAISVLWFPFNLLAQHQVVPVGPEHPTPDARLRKLSPQEKERLFGNQQAWQQKYEERFRTAPAQEQKRILAERADIQKRGRKYTVGYTSVSGASPKKFAEPAGLPLLMKRPRPQGLEPLQLSFPA